MVVSKVAQMVVQKAASKGKMTAPSMVVSLAALSAAYLDSIFLDWWVLLMVLNLVA